MILHMALKQRENAKQFCLALSEKRRTESWKIYVHLKNQSKKSFEEIKHLLREHFKLKYLDV